MAAPTATAAAATAAPTLAARATAAPASAPATTGAADRATSDELAVLDALDGGGGWSVGGHEVELTNLDKVLFPGAGFTKRDLVRYYTTIAPVILPYLRERPLNVHRWPDGVGGKTQFWQKQIPAHAPEWVARWDYPEAGRTQSHTYVVADRVATMAWLANQACIDLHPWTSRLPDYRRPTYAYIDIDPGAETTWSQLITLATLYRTALEHLGVRGYPKVTGKRGIQVWINVAPKYTFDETRDWVGGLSRGVGAVVPDLVSWEWTKADRGGRARLDYTQNSLIKTLVAPYAVRPVPSGAVSAPIAWDELEDPDLAAGRWDMRTIMERVAKHGDLFAGVLGDPQELAADLVAAQDASIATGDGFGQDERAEDDEDDRPQPQGADHVGARELHQADEREDAAGDQRPPVVLREAVDRADDPDAQESACDREHHHAALSLAAGRRIEHDADAYAGEDRAGHEEAVLTRDHEHRQQGEPDEHRDEAADVRLHLTGEEEQADARNDEAGHEPTGIPPWYALPAPRRLRLRKGGRRGSRPGTVAGRRRIPRR